VHAKTRLEEEIYLFKEIENPVSLRSGMVYGNGILTHLTLLMRQGPLRAQPVVTA
jgi:hypothetical protein